MSVPFLSPPVPPNGEPEFDIVATYEHLLATDDDITMPVAAIEALIHMLKSTNPTTVFETLEMIKHYANILKNNVSNSLPLTAGTDLFTQFLVSSLKRQEREHQASRNHQKQSQEAASAAVTASVSSQSSSPSRRPTTSSHHTAPPRSAAAEAASDFDAMRNHIVQNGSLFAQRARAARNRIASAGHALVRDGDTVMVHGASRTVSTLLLRAASESQRRNAGTVRFRVVYVRDPWRGEESDRVIQQLRTGGILVADVPATAVAHVMSKLRCVQSVIVGAEAVTQDGGVISRLGTLQLAHLARVVRPTIPFYVATEEHKFVRQIARYRDGLFGEELEHLLLNFRSDNETQQPANPVDWTPPQLVTNFITENGVKPPSYVTEQLLEIYGTLTPQYILDDLQREMAKK